MKKKKIIIIIATIIIIVILIGLSIFIFSNRKDKKIEEIPLAERYDGWIDLTELENAKVKDRSKYNTSKKLKEEHTYEKYSFSDAKLYSKDGCSYFEFTMTNLKEEKVDINRVLDLKFLDEKGNNIHIINFNMPNIKPGESQRIVSSAIHLDIVNAYDYKVEGF